MDLKILIYTCTHTYAHTICICICICICTHIYMYRLSYERRGDISFIARETISYFVKYDIVTRAIKLILPSLECDNLFITYLCLI